ncbi:hypothetical protein HMI56_002165 [Coelomomyces lativittatus]|nr:hypothetical protein HMI56_002165 [Coelomomyces lativittatus]
MLVTSNSHFNDIPSTSLLHRKQKITSEPGTSLSTSNSTSSLHEGTTSSSHTTEKKRKKNTSPTPMNVSTSSTQHPHTSLNTKEDLFPLSIPPQLPPRPLSTLSSSSSTTFTPSPSSPSSSSSTLSHPLSSLTPLTTSPTTTQTSNTTSPLSTASLLMEKQKKWENWRIRTFWTMVMVITFLGLILSAQMWVIFMVIAVQLAVFKEVIQIAHVPSKEKKLPWFRLITWYFLVTTNYYLYGESVLMVYFAHLIPPWLRPLATHHRLISFSLYCIGLVFFVLNLKKGFYKFQFSQFAWTHMALLLIVVQSHAVINNIFEGLFWFFVPCSLVIVNDIFAYICGFFWGKTPLIKLSPKKTWEGFLGGAVCTMIFGFIVCFLFSTLEI